VTNFTDQSQSGSSSFATRWRQLLDDLPWLAYVLPFVVFMVFGLIEPNPAATTSPAAPPAEEAERTDTETAAPESGSQSRSAGLSYPIAYSLRLSATILAVLLVSPVWRTIPGRVHWIGALTVGVLGGVLWVAICRWQLEARVLEAVGLAEWASWGARAAYDPYTHLGDTPWGLAVFLAIRLTGLALIVPLLEEIFLRGFLMRFIQQPDWWKIPLGSVTAAAAVTATVYGILAHPAEPIAAAVWFSLITFLYVRTKSLWDCVIAHAVTNALLGIYVLAFRDWTLW
jgi:hypothetical protein